MNPLRIAITGMHRGENPRSGSTVVSAIRRRWPDAFIVGLVYDAYESGIYAPDGPDVCHVMPYPALGLSTYLSRLQEIRKIDSFDLFIPTLDAEIALLAGSTAKLADMGIHATLPCAETLARCSKAKLVELASACDIPVPHTVVAHYLQDAVLQAELIGYPVFITSDDSYRLLEIHPHFPAWVGLPTQLGVNFPAAWINWMVEGECELLPDLLPGQYFLRHQVEVTGDIGQLATVLSDAAALHSKNQTLASWSVCVTPRVIKPSGSRKHPKGSGNPSAGASGP